MRILYIIGNGFDLAMGLKTSYNDFYDYLRQNYQKCSQPLQGLLEEINLDKELRYWSDLESAFGDYTSRIKNIEELKVLYEDLNRRFNGYLMKVESAFNPSIKKKIKIGYDLVEPDKYLNDNERMLFKEFLRTQYAYFFKRTIMTFNYTRTLEKLGINTFPCNKLLTLSKIIHVHGKLNDGIVIGVNDVEQIANKDFRNNELAKDLLIKEQSNRSMGYTRHEDCEALIKKANIIVIYGTSLGITDKRWWLLIGQQIAKRKNICVFYFFRTKNNLDLKQYFAEEKRNKIDFLMERFGFDNPSQYPTDLSKRLFLIPNAKFLV